MIAKNTLEVDYLLDDLLGSYAKDDTRQLSHHSFAKSYPDTTIRISAVEHLRARGFIADTGMQNPVDAITIPGLIYYGNDGLRGETRKQLRTKWCHISKTVATVLYSLLVLIVAAWGEYAQFNS